MKSRIQAQEQIESQYSDVLDFFEIGCKEPADQAHEQLLEVLTTFTSKLEKMIQTINSMEAQLKKSSEENSGLKEQRKKMIRELKRCEEMIEKACAENERIEGKLHEMHYKADRSDIYIKQLHIIIEADWDIIARNALKTMSERKKNYCQMEE